MVTRNLRSDTYGSLLRQQAWLFHVMTAGIVDVFGSQQLQLGGPVHMETLTLLHAFSGLAGAQKVTEVCALMLALRHTCLWQCTCVIMLSE